MLYPRFIKPQLKDALKDTPVILLHGPRQSGKTTLALDVGSNKYNYITFDDEAELAAAKRDPKGYIEDLPPYCILDEIQRVPEIFPSIKLVVDRDRYPGRFLLTGSANILAIPRLSESLAGRMEIINLRPLAQTEIEGVNSLFLQNIFNGKIKANFKKRLGDQLFDRLVAGGFPEPLTRDNQKRRRAWYNNYLNVMVQKDITEFSNIQYGEEIPTLLKRLANNTANLVNVAELNKGLSFDAKTAKKYIHILTQLFLVDALPPWYTNRNKRLIKTPKIHLCDTGLLCALSALSKKHLIKDRATTGHVVESFIYNELIKQADWHDDDLQFFHYKDRDANEVDIVIQNDAGELIGIEVKLAASVNDSDFKGLRLFQKQHPTRFLGGYILYDGERTLPYGNGFKAIPIQALWKKSQK